MATNKHYTIAMIVAPLLALISYFATDLMVSDLPEVAKAGGVYPMLAKSNCRYHSGRCTLRNGDFEIELRLDKDDTGQAVLLAHSNQPLDAARVELINSADAEIIASLNQETDQTLGRVKPFQQSDEQGEYWQLTLGDDMAESSELRIAMLTQEMTFFASTETTFFDYDTVFPRHNWEH